MRRVVITGLGAVSPCGPDLEATWAAIVSGRSGIGPITRFDASEQASRIAGEVKGFDPERWMDRKKVRQGHTFVHYAEAASRMAVEMAGFSPTEEEKERVGTIIGVGFGGMGLIEEMVRVLAEKGARRVSPHFIPAVIANLAAGQVSMTHGFKGASFSTTSACASGAHGIGEAFRMIRHGYLDACLAGGSESAIAGITVAGFAQMRALSRRNDDPEHASRPFDRGRDGFVLSEGAGMVLLEEREAAMARGADAVAEVVGYGATADAHHLTRPADDGEGAQRAMRAALREAEAAPSEVDYLNAHATSTDAGDLSEIIAIQKVFGDHARGRLMLSSTKSMTGHLCGAAGALETVLTALALQRGVVPPTTNLDDPMEEAAGMDLVPKEARRASLRLAVNNSMGFGGANACLVLKKA